MPRARCCGVGRPLMDWGEQCQVPGDDWRLGPGSPMLSDGSKAGGVIQHMAKRLGARTLPLRFPGPPEHAVKARRPLGGAGTVGAAGLAFRSRLRGGKWAGHLRPWKPLPRPQPLLQAAASRTEATRERGRQAWCCPQTSWHTGRGMRGGGASYGRTGPGVGAQSSSPVPDGGGEGENSQNRRGPAGA